MYQSGRVGDKAKKCKFPAKSGRVGITVYGRLFHVIFMYILMETGETSGLEGKKANWFSEGPYLRCFVIFLVFHFNSNKRIPRVSIKKNYKAHKYNSQNH